MNPFFLIGNHAGYAEGNMLVRPKKRLASGRRAFLPRQPSYLNTVITSLLLLLLLLFSSLHFLTVILFFSESPLS